MKRLAIAVIGVSTLLAAEVAHKGIKPGDCLTWAQHAMAPPTRATVAGWNAWLVEKQKTHPGYTPKTHPRVKRDWEPIACPVETAPPTPLVELISDFPISQFSRNITFIPFASPLLPIDIVPVQPGFLETPDSPEIPGIETDQGGQNEDYPLETGDFGELGGVGGFGGYGGTTGGGSTPPPTSSVPEPASLLLLGTGLLTLAAWRKR